MNANPLPVVPTVIPAQTAGASQQANASSQRNNAAFNAHLQNAQRQQTSSSDADQDSNSQDNGNDQATTGAPANASTPSATKQPGAGAGAGAAQASDTDSSDGDTASLPASLESLASTVLNLIGQATSDTDGDSSTASGSKAAGAKPSTQTSNPQAQPATAQAATVVPMPPPVVPAPPATGKGGTDADSSVTALSSSNHAPGGNQAAVQSALLAQKTPGANTGFDSTDDSDSSDSAAVGAPGDSTASLQAAADGAQAMAGTLLAGSHVASTAAALPTASTTSTNTPDLTVLRGIVDATAVAAPSGANGTSTHDLSINTPVGSSGFAKELGQQVTWLSGQDMKQAQIRLNPQDLGPLDVKVSVEHGRVDVAFMTQHPATAAAVQQGLDQLHQMLGGQGLSLGHTSVGQQSAQQQFAGQQQQSASGQAAADADNSVESTATETLQRIAVGLVDAFA